MSRACRGGQPFRLIFLLAVMTGVLSAFLDNLTAILLVVPISLQLSRLLGIPVVPLVLVQVMASNIGGTATLIGDPPNIMIGTHVEELSFLDFIVNLGPVAAVTLLMTTLLLYVFYRRSLDAAPDARERVAALDPRGAEAGATGPDPRVLGGTIVGFFLHAPLHVEPVVVAMTGATAMLLVAGRELEWALERVEWGTIFFFLGLFIMVGALEEQGVIAKHRRRVRRRHRRLEDRRSARHPVGCCSRVGPRRQHPLHGRDDPGRRRAPDGRVRRCDLVGARARRVLRRQRDADRGGRQRRGRLRTRAERDADLVPALSRGWAADHVRLARDRDRLPGRRSSCETVTTMNAAGVQMTRGSLYQRVFLLNAAIFVVATLVLVITPATISFPVELTEAIVLVVGLGAILVLNAFALRTAFAPLDRLMRLMREVDPQRPGERLEVAGPPEVRELVVVFNDMLDRLEHERRESGRRALAAQEGERWRVAQELHDDVGQVLTGVLLRLESLARQAPHRAPRRTCGRRRRQPVTRSSGSASSCDS